MRLLPPPMAVLTYDCSQMTVEPYIAATRWWSPQMTPQLSAWLAMKKKRSAEKRLPSWSNGGRTTTLHHCIRRKSKTKELIVDFRNHRGTHFPIIVDRTLVEISYLLPFPGTTCPQRPCVDPQHGVMLKKANQCLYPLHKQWLVNYRGAIESILLGGVTDTTQQYDSMTITPHGGINRMVEKIPGCALPSIQEIFRSRCRRKARSIIHALGTRRNSRQALSPYCTVLVTYHLSLGFVIKCCCCYLRFVYDIINILLRCTLLHFCTNLILTTCYEHCYLLLYLLSTIFNNCYS